MPFSKLSNFSDYSRILSLVLQQFLLLELQLVLHLFHPFGCFSFLLFVAFAHFYHLAGGFQRIEYLQVNDVSELQELLLLVILLLVLNVNRCLGDLVPESSQLLFQLLLFDSDILLFLLQFLYSVTQPLKLRGGEHDS